ncbi:MAG TPA: hypothetical protein VGQ57_02025 [Polyangiaceae bacterium]|jgi:hypothetical protein|nr:hypothetical protein [Polyangiaceae bacterium]
MKLGIAGVLGLSVFGVALAGGCGGDTTPADDGASRAKRGGAGHGGSGGAPADDGLAGALIAPLGGGSAGRRFSGSGGAAAGHAGRGGAQQRGGHGGSGGTHAASAGEAGNGGDPNGTECFGVTTGSWVEVTDDALSGSVAKYGAVVPASEFDGADARIELTVHNPDTGLFELGTGDDANLETCQHCVTLNVAKAGGGAARLYFADQGRLVIASDSAPLAGVLSADLTGVHFVEVVVDGSGKSSPVEGAACVTVAASHVGVDRSSGGAGGEGGMGGAGGAGGDGSLDGYPVPDDCIEVTTGPPWTVSMNEGFTGYGSVMQPNFGSPESDPIAVGFYSDETGTIHLGPGQNATWASCIQCILARIPDDTVSGRLFFGAAGTIEVASGGLGPMSGTIDATLSDISLIEMTSDLSAPIENGMCLHLQGTTVQVPE